LLILNIFSQLKSPHSSRDVTSPLNEGANRAAIPYRGRIAPTPTGHLHLGHAATFLKADERAGDARGVMILRIEDLDPHRCSLHYADAAIEDLRWLGVEWQEGPFYQSRRVALYLDVWRKLRDGGFIYPCVRSRRDVAQAALAPHEKVPVFPIEWRTPVERGAEFKEPEGRNWRFRVPDGEEIEFVDGNYGHVRRVALRDFGDFVVWNRDNIPAYELAAVVDDLATGVTEVVRGEDLLTSTARQILIYRALASAPPAFFHCPLILDKEGRRLAKRDGSLSLRALRERGYSAEWVIAQAKAQTARS
jgi:glutamyl/glutaminyl-tRNA synthetase